MKLSSLQDHLWKIPMAMEKWINWWAEEEAKNRDKFRGRKNVSSNILSRHSQNVIIFCMLGHDLLHISL